MNGTWEYYGLIGIHDQTTLATTLVASPFTNNSVNEDDAPLGPNTALIPGETGGGFIQIATATEEFSDHGTGSVPGLLNVHGGANFFCGEWTAFTVEPDINSVSGNIDVMYDGDVFQNSEYNDNCTELTLGGKTILQDLFYSSTLSRLGKWRLHGEYSVPICISK